MRLRLHGAEHGQAAALLHLPQNEQVSALSRKEKSLKRTPMKKIITSFDPPPIPGNAFNWRATFDSYEPGSPIGYGRTEEEAIHDLHSHEEALEYIANRKTISKFPSK
jgi:hypothetical protein